MNQDTGHQRLLAIFHYIVSGLAALFSFFTMLYTIIRGIFIFAARHGTPKPGEELPPEFLGWIFIAILGVFTMANAIFIPFGTTGDGPGIILQGNYASPGLKLRSRP